MFAPALITATCWHLLLLLLLLRLLILRRIEELKQFISTRPEKTNNTYWPLEEKLLVST